MEAIARQLFGRNVVPELAVFGTFGHQVRDEVAELALRSGDVFTSMQECRELGAVERV